MADKNNTIKTTVVIEASTAKQEIAKLNGVASDSTKELDERIKAKNKSVELENDLAKKTIKNLEDEVKVLQKANASEKEVLKVIVKLNKAKENFSKVSARNEKSLNS